MTDALRPPPDPRFEKLVRRSLISALVGVAIVLVATFGVSPGLRLRLVVYGALAGVFINLSCYALGQLYRRWIPPTAFERERLALAAVYFVGGYLGFVLATALALATSLVPPFTMRQVLYSAAISGGIAIVVGLLFYTFSRLQDRLRESVERLKEHEFAEKELELARSIQKRLLPPAEMEANVFRVAGRNVAARFVAGDFYDVFPVPAGALGVAVADVSGKGMGASLIMASVKAVLPLVAAQRTVAETLDELNRKLVAELGPREFVALAYARCEADGHVTLGNAGLPDPYVVRVGAGPRMLAVLGARFPLGSRREVSYGILETRLEPGEKLVVFTDGLPEAPTAAGDPIGYAAFEKLLSGDPLAAPGPFLDAVFDQLRSATEPVLADDWTAVAVERVGSGLHMPRDD